jgi:NAD(P)-dependent dehydrogenase (short-subunit alcohol dehydrogenase family)
MRLTDGCFRLDEKVALVTGGCGGIGEVVSHGLAEMGAKVAIADIRRDEADRCAEALREMQCDSYSLGFDVLSVADTQRMVDEVAAHYKRLDILVNCVGLQREETGVEVTETNFDHVFHVNLKGAMFQAQAAARHMIKQGTGGKQVHMGSVRSLLALRGRGFAAYCATKGGLAIMCKQLATEWAPHGINVNVVAPTFVRTQQVARWLEDPDFYKALVARIPMGRIAEPEDVMRVILFFVSPASDYVTGQTLYLDGGLTATQ